MASTMSCFARWITSESSTYQVQSFLGQGAFGKVVKCMRMTDMKTVAIKLLINHGSNRWQINAELAALSRVKSLDPDKCNIVRWYSSFLTSGHVCFEFELLEKSLYDFMRERYFQPLPLKEIRPIVQQVANALSHLRSIRLIHADLKLENIMFVNHGREPYRVKVIDFGLADHVSAARPSTYIQTRPYRSPEIILGLPFTEAIDMWSLGCISAALYLGTLLYTGENEYDMMRYIVETQGNPPQDLLSLGKNTRCFFRKYRQSITSVWKLKTPDEFYIGSWVESRDTRKWRFTSLDDLLRIRVISHPNAADKAAEMTDQMMFVDMLKGMLHLDASKRIKPHEVLMHRFISMSHMLSLRPQSSYVNACIHIMDLCQKSNSAAESQKATYRSLQQPTIKPPSLQLPTIKPPFINPPTIKPPSIQPPTIKPPFTNPFQRNPPHHGWKSKVTHPRSHPIKPDPWARDHIRRSSFDGLHSYTVIHQPQVSSSVNSRMADGGERPSKMPLCDLSEKSGDGRQRLLMNSGAQSAVPLNFSTQLRNSDSDMMSHHNRKQNNGGGGSTMSSSCESSSFLNDDQQSHSMAAAMVPVSRSPIPKLKIYLRPVPRVVILPPADPCQGSSTNCASSSLPTCTSLPRQRPVAQVRRSKKSEPVPKWAKNIRALLKKRNERLVIR